MDVVERVYLWSIVRLEHEGREVSVKISRAFHATMTQEHYYQLASVTSLSTRRIPIVMDNPPLIYS